MPFSGIIIIFDVSSCHIHKVPTVTINLFLLRKFPPLKISVNKFTISTSFEELISVNAITSGTQCILINNEYNVCSAEPHL